MFLAWLVGGVISGWKQCDLNIFLSLRIITTVVYPSMLINFYGLFQPLFSFLLTDKGVSFGILPRLMIHFPFVRLCFLVQNLWAFVIILFRHHRFPYPFLKLVLISFVHLFVCRTVEWNRKRGRCDIALRYRCYSLNHAFRVGGNMQSRFWFQFLFLLVRMSLEVVPGTITLYVWSQGSQQGLLTVSLRGYCAIGTFRLNIMILDRRVSIREGSFTLSTTVARCFNI